jgi:putative transposase
MVAFIDAQRDAYGVEPICRVLPIAPSTYFRRKSHHADPTRRAARAQRDDELRAIIRRIWTEHHQVYGPRKVWRQMGRENLRAARCRVRRLMREMGLAGAVRGRAWVTTTEAAPGSERPVDLVDRQFTATRPNQLWVADLTGLRVRRVCHRHLCASHRRVAGLVVPGHGLRPRCPGPGDL